MADQSVPLQPSDLGIVFVSPQSQDDPRVPTAPDVSAIGDLALRLSLRSRQQAGWASHPMIAIAPPRTLTLTGGQAYIPLAPDYAIAVPTSSVIVPAIPTTTSVINRTDRLSLVAIAAEVGAEQDTELGSVVFKARASTGEIVDSAPKENTRRWRFFWMWVISPDPINAAALYATLPTDANGDRVITISNTTTTGFALGTLQLYAADTNWATGKTYKVLGSDRINILPTASIWRVQNFTDRGYTWGNGGEEDLSTTYSVVPDGAPLPKPGTDPVRDRLRQIVSAQTKPYSKSVQNFAAGSVASNLGRVGEAAASPNNSVCLGSRNRVSYSNEGYIETLAVQRITAGNDGSGNALISAIAENLPTGYRFSEVAANHKIYLADGTEISQYGRFGNLGGVGALTWIADANQFLLPGQIAYVVPAIVMPSGSGFNVPFTMVDAAWDGATNPIDPANIRNGATADLDAYETPANNESFIVVYGTERAAIHRIYKHVLVTIDPFGAAIVPSTEFGCFAFISGVSGRIDKPVVTGLTPNTTVGTLIYYPPRNTEYWQFQLRTVPYLGSAATTEWLNGARVVSEIVTLAHTQGGGGKVFQGAAETRLSPISMMLPAATSTIASHSLAMPIQIAGSGFPGASSRVAWDFGLLPASGRSQPAPGAVLTAADAATTQPRSLRTKLSINGTPIGFRAPRLENGWAYQAVVAFAAEKMGDRRLIVATRNTTGGDFTLDSDTGTAIGAYTL